MGLRCTFLVVLACLVAAFAPSVPGTAQARGSASLSVTPGAYYAGQGLLFTGSLDRSGERRIWLEFHMNRPGDAWTVVPHSGGRTNSDGSFSFRHPAPGMKNISLRVASAVGATPGRTMHASIERTAISISPNRGLWSILFDLLRYNSFVSYPAVAGESFTVTVDTAPEGGPVLVGRTIDLQQRTRRGGWKTIGTGTAPSNGLVRFTRTVAQPGKVVYRARAAGWTRDGSDIGWNPGFPTYVYVVDEDGDGPQPPSVPEGEVTPPPSGSAAEGTTAASRYGWGQTLYDFAFEWGESLSDKPFRGTRRRGRWKDTSTGSGRGGRYNGGLFLESKYGKVAPRDAGSGDRGTTALTLSRNAQTHGRWEIKLRSWQIGEYGDRYRVRVELIPDDPARRACGARGITLGEFTPTGDKITFGARAPDGNRSWTGVRRNLNTFNTPHSLAVEVTADHITWFVDGTPVGTVRDRDALPGVPLTPRLSLVGGNNEMKHTYAGADWVRAWSMRASHPVTTARALERGRHSISCG